MAKHFSNILSTMVKGGIYGPVTKWRHWGMFIHWGNKLGIPLNAIQVEMPPALRS